MLNCHLPDHSVRSCPHKFLNNCGVFNPDLGLMNDDSQTFQRWQARMLSYRATTDTQAARGNQCSYGGQNNFRSKSQWRRGRRHNNDIGVNYTPDTSQTQQHTPASGTIVLTARRASSYARARRTVSPGSKSLTRRRRRVISPSSVDSIRGSGGASAEQHSHGRG